MEHDSFKEVLEDCTPAEVWDISDVLMQAQHDESLLDELKNYVARALDFSTTHIFPPDLEKVLGQKRYTIERLSAEKLVETCLLLPAITCKYNVPRMNTGFDQDINVRPLNNFIFLRDQQIITDKGIVVGNMNSSKRSSETWLMQFVFKVLGVRLQTQLYGELKLEGGDFIPAGDIAFQGVGLRTNMEAVRELLQRQCYGFPEVAVVVDQHRQQDEMHLDTYFNITSRDTCFVLDERVKERPTGSRKDTYVVVYRRRDDGTYHAANATEVFGGNGAVSKRELRYDETTPMFPFRDYLSEKGFRIVEVSKELQQSYALNFLTIGENKVVGIDIAAKEDLKKRLVSLERRCGPQDFFPMHDYHRLGSEFQELMARKGIHFIPVVMNDLNLMYGSAHCMTQVARAPIVGSGVPGGVL